MSSSECYRCHQRGHFARDCPNESSGGGAGAYGGGGAGKCYRCNRTGHLARDCTETERCYNCEGTGHVARDCPNERSGGGGAGPPGDCYNSGQSGHFARDCRGSGSGGGGGGGGRGGGGGCYNCGKSGHFARECTENKHGVETSRGRAVGAPSEEEEEVSTVELIMAPGTRDQKSEGAETSRSGAVGGGPREEEEVSSVELIMAPGTRDQKSGPDVPLRPLPKLNQSERRRLETELEEGGAYHHDVYVSPREKKWRCLVEHDPPSAVDQDEEEPEGAPEEEEGEGDESQESCDCFKVCIGCEDPEAKIDGVFLDCGCVGYCYECALFWFRETSVYCPWCELDGKTSRITEVVKVITPGPDDR